MYRIIGGRGTGKTYRLLEKASEVGGIVVCSNPAAMREKAHVWGFTGIEFMQYHDYIAYYCEKPVFIDELELYVKSISGRTLQGYTYSLEDEEV
jgi:hypothetical protein